VTGARALLRAYVEAGKLTQVATLGPDGSPSLCNVWYDAHFMPDVLRFISRHDRHHCQNIRRDPRVGGSIIAIDLDGLGQVARGVTYTGQARELPRSGIAHQLGAFLARWPAAAGAIDADRLSRGETPTRLYEIAVSEWVLFDEGNFPDQPRQVIEAQTIIIERS